MIRYKCQNPFVNNCSLETLYSNNIHLFKDWFYRSYICKASDKLTWEILLIYDNISQQTIYSQWDNPIQNLPRHSISRMKRMYWMNSLMTITKEMIKKEMIMSEKRLHPNSKAQQKRRRTRRIMALFLDAMRFLLHADWMVDKRFTTWLVMILPVDGRLISM